jgi:uncharacterized protein (TIGR02145 family)
MKKVISILSAVLIIAILATSCGGDGSNNRTSSIESASSKSINDANFSMVTIGKQVWMTQNLNVDKFRNGDPIPEAKTEEEWRIAGKTEKPAWCYYDNDPTNGEKYGKLYNWYAVNDPRGLAPKGWHIPSHEEWKIMSDYLGGERVAGKKMKSSNGWELFHEQNGNGTNESGFTGFPGGSRSGRFNKIGKNGNWWSCSEYDAGGAWTRNLDYDDGSIDIGRGVKERGMSVRCIKD